MSATGSDKLKFGTDGWRDVIGDRFTVVNVSRAAQAYAEHLLERGEGRVVVGYDNRFNGALFARKAAEVLAANGLEALMSNTSLPTPALSFAVKHYRAGGGVMLTASHNPPEYLGFKLKGAYGGTATDAIYRDVSRRVGEVAASPAQPFDATRHALELFDIRESYWDHLSKLLNVAALRSFDGAIVHDAMGGSAAGWLAGYCRHAGLRLEVRELRGAADPMFYGVNPEPIARNLAATMAPMRESDAVFATATDGDGDRLGLVLPGGEFFNSHQIFAVMLDVLHRQGKRGAVVKTFTVSRIVERLAVLRGLEVRETPVGFKHIVQAMLENNVLIGGEESGGIGVAGHIPERDGIANSLLLLEAVITSGLSLAECFRAIEVETGWRHAYDRLDLQLGSESAKHGVLAALRDAPDRFAGREVNSVETLDGAKLNLTGDAWILFRVSGTEPVLRIYCEAQEPGEVAEILTAARAFVERSS